MDNETQTTVGEQDPSRTGDDPFHIEIKSSDGDSYSEHFWPMEAAVEIANRLSERFGWYNKSDGALGTVVAIVERTIVNHVRRAPLTSSPATESTAGRENENPPVSSTQLQAENRWRQAQSAGCEQEIYSWDGKTFIGYGIDKEQTARIVSFHNATLLQPEKKEANGN